MSNYLHNGSAAFFATDEMASENGARALTEAECNHPAFEIGKMLTDSGGWIDAPEAEEIERNVPVRYYIMSLLGTTAHSQLKATRLMLGGKIQADIATEEEKAIWGALDTAKDLMALGSEINLLDPLVAEILDIAISLPNVDFTAADKERVLSTGVIESA